MDRQLPGLYILGMNDDVLPSTNPTDHFEICMYSYLLLISRFHPHHVVGEWASHNPAAGSRFGLIVADMRPQGWDYITAIFKFHS
jgi:hypothetical protein